MTDDTQDRLINTRDGMERIPRGDGIPFKEYFKNAEWPKDPTKAVVHATPTGPVLTKPDPVAWNASHDEVAKDYASRLKWVIDKRGYYGKTLQRYVSELRDLTTEPEDQVRNRIVAAFVETVGAEPKAYLEAQRITQGRTNDTSIANGAYQEPEM